MLFCFYNLDKPGTDLRTTLRPAHRNYLTRFADRFAFAGPLMASDGTTPVGSLLVLDFDSWDDAMAFINNEPYTVAGLYESIDVRPFANLWEQRAGFPHKG